MLLKAQNHISPWRGMPVSVKDSVSAVVSVTGETVQLYYYTALGVLTADAGQAAGTSVVAQLNLNNVKNALGAIEGSKADTSLSFTSADLITEKHVDFAKIHSSDELSGVDRLARIVDGFANGEYCVDYANGLIYGKKASNGTTLTAAAYKVRNAIVDGSIATPTIYNKACTTHAVEYSQALPSGTKKVLVKSRSASDLNICFTSGESATKYILVPAGSSGLWLDNLILNATTLYFQFPSDDTQVVEILVIK